MEGGHDDAGAAQRIAAFGEVEDGGNSGGKTVELEGILGIGMCSYGGGGESLPPSDVSDVERVILFS